VRICLAQRRLRPFGEYLPSPLPIPDNLRSRSRWIPEPDHAARATATFGLREPKREPSSTVMPPSSLRHTLVGRSEGLCT
jgi:hypothetical protein